MHAFTRPPILSCEDTGLPENLIGKTVIHKEHVYLVINEVYSIIAGGWLVMLQRQAHPDWIPIVAYINDIVVCY